MEKPIVNLIEVSQLMAAIGLIGRNSAKVQATIQFAAVQCIAQSIVHRNATPAKELVNNLPRGMRVDSLIAFLEKFGNLAYSKVDNEVKFFDVAELTGLPALEWTNAYSNEVKDFDWTKGTKPATIVSKYDFEEDFGKFLTVWEKRASDFTKDIKHRDLLDKIRLAFNTYVAQEQGTAVDANDASADAIHARDFNNKIVPLSKVRHVAESAIEELLAEADVQVAVIEGLEEIAA